MEQAACIICGEKNFSHFLNVKCKYSNEIFSLNKCKCSLVLTSPRPSSDKMDFNKLLIFDSNSSKVVFKGIA